MPNQPNPDLLLANEFVRFTDRHVFLTGKAGTGKTTFLHDLKKDCPKRMIVTAPTGVAAINAGGVTLHSFFQLPFGPFVPGRETQDRGGQHRFSKVKLDIIRSLDLLVIDEISMVRADVLDSVDAALRRHRRSDSPFAGVQLLMIGDLCQLAPVVTENEKDILAAHYDSPYFFCSRALAGTALVTVELKQIYRQSDPRFIELLNRVRDNKLDAATLAELNRRCQPGFAPPDGHNSVVLSTHNRSADATNRNKLEALPARAFRFQAEVDGEFPEYMYPTDAVLELKVGAQVMFVRNDASPEKRYYNGKIGKITRIDEDIVFVKCPGDDRELGVGPLVWVNTRYMVDPDTKEIVETPVGKFEQYPLRLAWAITIHKSQGLTFERAVIDAQAAFAPGQVYVALSRCKSLEGMVLSSPLSAGSVRTDHKVQRFGEAAAQKPPSAGELLAAKIEYQRRLLHECFDFQALGVRIDRLVGLVAANEQVVKVLGADDLGSLARRWLSEVCAVGDRFGRQLAGIFAAAAGILPETDDRVLERIGKATGYFGEKLAALGEELSNIDIETDNKEIRKRANEAILATRKEAAIKLAGVRSCQTGFSPARYLREIAVAAIDFGAVKPQPVERRATDAAGEVGHAALFKALVAWRARKATEAGVPHHRILQQKALVQIAATLPRNSWELERIKGIGKRAGEKYAAELVALVSDFRLRPGLQVDCLPKGALGEITGDRR